MKQPMPPSEASLQNVENSPSGALIRAVDRASAAIQSSLGPDSPLLKRLLILHQRLVQTRLQIAVLGQFKRGKSTFVNALLGAPILPTAVVPLTAIPTFISWADDALVQVQFANVRSPERFSVRDPESIRAVLSRFVTEQENPKNRLNVERVDLFYPAAILQDGTVLIDTPGIGSTLAHNTEAALRVLPECDASLFIISADPPITEAELSYLHQLKPKIGKIFFVINKIDYLTTDERRGVSDFLRDVLARESFIDPETQIYAVSARMALSARLEGDDDALKKSGMSEIEEHLKRYLVTEKMRTLVGAIKQKTVDLLLQAKGEIELRAQALKMPLEQLEQKSFEFSRVLSLIEIQHRTIGDLLSGDRRRLLAELETRTQTLREQASSKLARAIDDNLPFGQVSFEQNLRLTVSTTLEDVFGAAAEQLVKALSQQANDILTIHRQRVDGLVDEVRRTAAQMFDVALAGRDRGEVFRLAQEPYWVTEQIASSLIPDLSPLVDRLLPASVRRRRRRRRVIKQTGELIIRNAESLRWAILRGLDETFRLATSQFAEQLGEAIAETKGIIEDVLALRRYEFSASEATLDRLTQSMEVLGAAQKAVEASETDDGVGNSDRSELRA